MPLEVEFEISALGGLPTVTFDVTNLGDAAIASLQLAIVYSLEAAAGDDLPPVAEHVQYLELDDPPGSLPPGETFTFYLATDAVPLLRRMVASLPSDAYCVVAERDGRREQVVAGDDLAEMVGRLG
jgi:hypothetical protein